MAAISRLILFGLLIENCLLGQTYNGVLLPEPRTIRGVVVDPRGIPVQGAEIGHAGLRLDATGSITDAQGRFEVITRAPQIVVRKAGYASVLLRTSATPTNGDQRLVLHTAKRSLVGCPENGKYEAIAKWGSRFRFASMPQIRVTKQVQDVDYGMRSYYLNTAKGPKGIRHGSGPMWSFGLPSDSDVWKSVTFEEDSFDVDGIRIVESKGEWADGTRWRTIGKFGESASYSGVDGETAKVLDPFMDGVCIAAPGRAGR